jgi:hypothetical protein
LLVPVPGASAAAPGSSCRYFYETGHYVCDEFLSFFDTRGEVEIFGQPLTEAFIDDRAGRLVQYFQRARMEYHPDEVEPRKVQLGLLADELGYQFAPIGTARMPRFKTAVQRYFPQTGHTVSYAFLEFFLEHGGADIFGFPCSEYRYERGYIVQFFQRARMEWHPEVVSGPMVRLTNLGESYVERFGISAELLRPLPPPPGIASGGAPVRSGVDALHVSASVQSVITGAVGDQTVFVYVTDQRGQPVEGVHVTMAVHYEQGIVSLGLPLTDVQGGAKLTFPVRDAPPGRRAVIDVYARYEELVGSTQTFFLPWW